MSAAAHEPAAQALGPRLQQRRDRCEVVARRVQVVAREVEAVQREVGDSVSVRNLLTCLLTYLPVQREVALVLTYL